MQKYILPELPYAYSALEPYIDARTMELHHAKHHQAYIDTLNTAFAQHPDFNISLENALKDLLLVPEDIRTTVKNNGGGHINHSFFWNIMAPETTQKTPYGEIAIEIEKQFGSFAAFQELFNTAARIRFGSGWAWLAGTPQGTLQILSTANQDSPISQGLTPILGLDVWEHAYYLQYQNKRIDYITAWWSVINWEQVAQNYKNL